MTQENPQLQPKKDYNEPMHTCGFDTCLIKNPDAAGLNYLMKK